VFLGGVDGSYLDTFVGLIDALPENVRSRIHVVRAIADVGPWYRVSDFFLMNSSSEAYPRSVVEALLFGLPILSTKVFGVLEQVRPNENGFLYDFNAMDDWQSHFIRLVTDDDLRARMSVMAARSFWKLTTHAEMLHCYCSLLAQLQRKAQAPALVQLKAAE
jgi:glycosyltransferase involved in cell wall biosynthesis